jgi:NADPH-dependent F420 reductase
MTFDNNMQIGVVGGTGDLGRALALRFAQAGLHVRIGSRDAAKAKDAIAELVSTTSSIAELIASGTNLDVVAACRFLVLAVPWNAHESTVRELAPQLSGKVVVDCVNPLGFDERGPHRIDVAHGSAAEQAAAILPRSTVVGAFHHVSASRLMDPQVTDLDMDVLVLGDDRTATDTVSRLADLIPGMRGVFGGRLRNAGQVEAFTANLIAINRRYKARSSIRITGL